MRKMLVFGMIVLLFLSVLCLTSVSTAVPPPPPNVTFDSPCVAGTEICNGVDDDCDGSIDEGGVCPVSETSSPTTGGSSGGGGGGGGGGAGPIGYVPITSNNTITQNPGVSSSPENKDYSSNRSIDRSDNSLNIAKDTGYNSSLSILENANNKAKSTMASMMANPFILGAVGLVVLLLVVFIIFKIFIKKFPSMKTPSKPPISSSAGQAMYTHAYPVQKNSQMFRGPTSQMNYNQNVSSHNTSNMRNVSQTNPSIPINPQNVPNVSQSQNPTSFRQMQNPSVSAQMAHSQSNPAIHHPSTQAMSQLQAISATEHKTRPNTPESTAKVNETHAKIHEVLSDPNSGTGNVLFHASSQEDDNKNK